MGRARKRRPPRKRVGQVSYYDHHGGWWIYYRDGRKPVRLRVSGKQAEAAAAAPQVNAQLASLMPGGGIFTATSRFNRRCSALKTCPIPPEPMRSRSV